jgi:tRNA U34 5-methylaminomethyl-2-thiouridine-forming methyltransferase MnmC
MHNPVGPWAEANALYVNQSGIARRMMETDDQDLVIFDVGLGAAANAVAALTCARSLSSRTRGLSLISFERDLELLRFALHNSKHFQHFRCFETALEQILRDGHWSEGSISWQLRHGDFLELIEKEYTRPHIIFFDPYSPKVNQEMWTTRCFEKIRKKCLEAPEGGTTLYTYSRATRIRVALLKAGFFVGYGDSTGLKDETTVAATDRGLLKSPLDKAWLERWRASHVRYPLDCGPNDQSSIEAFIESQFD